MFLNGDERRRKRRRRQKPTEDGKKNTISYKTLYYIDLKQGKIKDCCSSNREQCMVKDRARSDLTLSWLNPACSDAKRCVVLAQPGVILVQHVIFWCHLTLREDGNGKKKKPKQKATNNQVWVQRRSRHKNGTRSGPAKRTCLHSSTQKMRYESFPYLPMPCSSTG